MHSENVSVEDNEWIYYVVVYTLAWYGKGFGINSSWRYRFLQTVSCAAAHVYLFFT